MTVGHQEFADHSFRGYSAVLADPPAIQPYGGITYHVAGAIDDPTIGRAGTPRLVVRTLGVGNTRTL